MKKLKPKRVLVVVAHPDDAEFTCGGSVANWVDYGASVAYLVCTDGSVGNQVGMTDKIEIDATRKNEQCDAQEFIGVDELHYLDFPDGKAEANIELKAGIVKVIRKFKPDTVVTFDPSVIYSTKYNIVNHTDHRAVGQATIDAVFPLARDDLSFPEHLKEGLESHITKNLLLVNYNEGNYFEDITKSFDKKIEACKKHKSQISGNNFEKRLRQMAEDCGQKCDTKLAEQFVLIRL